MAATILSPRHCFPCPREFQHPPHIPGLRLHHGRLQTRIPRACGQDAFSPPVSASKTFLSSSVMYGAYVIPLARILAHSFRFMGSEETSPLELPQAPAVTMRLAHSKGAPPWFGPSFCPHPSLCSSYPQGLTASLKALSPSAPQDSTT